MACIIKIPTKDTKGVISFTTQDRNQQILKNPRLIAKIEAMKKNWLVGLHHNWHDYKFKYNPLFDFSMAGEEDLKEVDGTKFSLLPMDACNFIPTYFRPAASHDQKFWDILYVARAVRFKKIPEFFASVRKLYDEGKHYRILFLCPVPPYKWSDRKTVFYDIRKVYERMFTEKEKDLFTLMTIDYRYPFPFDGETVAHFYRSSKIFIHFANDERRCRVAGNAWASGLPVVGMSCIGSLIPPELRKPPYYYEVNDYSEFNNLMERAVKEYDTVGDEATDYFDLEASKKRLRGHLERLMKERNLPYSPGGEYFENLDKRLGRHHIPKMKGPNNLDISVEKLLDFLSLHGNNFTGVFEGTEHPEEQIDSLVGK